MGWTSQGRRLRFAAAACLVALGACSSDDEGGFFGIHDAATDGSARDVSPGRDTGGALCVPGQQRACSCPTGGLGVQTCTDDGRGYTRCDDCRLGPEGGAGSGGDGTAGSGGQGGSGVDAGASGGEGGSGATAGSAGVDASAGSAGSSGSGATSGSGGGSGTGGGAGSGGTAGAAGSGGTGGGFTCLPPTCASCATCQAECLCWGNDFSVCQQCCPSSGLGGAAGSCPGAGGTAGAGGSGGTGGGSCNPAFCPASFGTPCCITPNGPCGCDTGLGCMTCGVGGSGGGPAASFWQLYRRLWIDSWTSWPPTAG